MEANEEDKQKKINDNVIVFLRKRSATEAPRYAARLKTYVDLQYKRRRAATARRNSEATLRNKYAEGALRKKNELEPSTGEATEGHRCDEEEDQVGRKRRGDKTMKTRSFSRSRSGEPSDRCGRRRRRRRRSCGRRRRRRRRSCRRRRRRRRSCRRRRRRRRSCSRRRRRRSCRRRRRRRRRRRC